MPTRTRETPGYMRVGCAGLTDEESDFIITYGINYRRGQDSVGDEDE